MCKDSLSVPAGAPAWPYSTSKRNTRRRVSCDRVSNAARAFLISICLDYWTYYRLSIVNFLAISHPFKNRSEAGTMGFRWRSMTVRSEGVNSRSFTGAQNQPPDERIYPDVGPLLE